MPKGEFDPATRLSERQADCLRLVAKGHTSKEIGRLLAISPSTVDNHIKAAVDRLGARNRIDAARTLTAQTAEPPNPARSRDEDFAIFRFPPLGGRPNRLSARARVFHILQIAMVAVAVCAAAILTIAGVVHLLSAGS